MPLADNVINKGKIDHDNWMVEEELASWAIDFWLTNLNCIKELIKKKEAYSNFAFLGIYSLAESISNCLFGKNSRYYFEKVLKIPNSHLIHEVFRNGFTHSLGPTSIKYSDAYVGWGYSQDTSPSGFRDYDFGETDPETGEVIFEPDEISEYIEFSPGNKHISLTLDRLVARIETDLNDRKNELKPEQKVEWIVAKKLQDKSPSGAKNDNDEE